MLADRPTRADAETHRRESRALGSPLRLTVWPEAEASVVDDAWAAILGEFAAVDRVMSRFRDDSEITLLHRSRRPQPLSGRMRTALALIDRARRATEGRFDAGVIRDLERLGSVAVPQAWTTAGSAIDTRAHCLGDGGTTVRLLAPVDLGGIGKGLALRWAAARGREILGGHGFLLDAGGDIASTGTAGGRSWSLAIEDPASGRDPVATCLLAPNGAVATSSTRLGRWRDPDGREVHHLIDPRTGRPGGEGLLAVTVACRDPAWSEIWSKALFIAGPKDIGDIARRKGLAAWWVAADGSLSMTPAARLATTWVRDEARLSPRGADEGRPRASRSPATG